MSTNEEGIQTRRQLMAGDDPEKSAAAAFELAVYFSQTGDTVEAESCFRHAIAVGHPAVTPAALLNLAGLLHGLGRSAEAVQTYKTLIALRDPGTLAMATYAIGFVLSGQPEHMEEGESFLRQAASSNDPEYGPLASYDLGVLLSSQPGRFSDAIRALTHAVASNHAEYAPRACFNLGVLLAANGAPAEAEEAFRQTMTASDPKISSMAAVNLGGLLEGTADRFADAEAAYQFAIDAQHPEQMRLAMLNLGNLLAQVPERWAESERAYRGAMLSPIPSVAASAAYNLGVLLVNNPLRRADAEAPFRTAGTSGDPEHAPLALYNLGRLLGEDVNRWADARQALEAAVNTGDQRVIGPANNLLSQLDVLRLPERLVPVLDANWRCIKAAGEGAFYLEEYLQGTETTDDWTAIATAMQALHGSVTPLAYMDAVREEFERGVIDGRVTWQVLEQTDDEIVYESEIADDIAQVDQHEVSRIVRRNDRLFTIQHAMRGDLAIAKRERARRLGLLRAATFQRAPAPTAIDSPEMDEGVAAANLEQAGAAAAMSVAKRVASFRDGLRQLSKDRHPAQWAMLHMQLALALAQQVPTSPANDDDLDEATASLRRALEIYKRQSHAELWALAVALLGRFEFVRAQRHGRSDNPAEQRLTRASLAHAIAAFDKARTVFKPGTYDWSRITADLADARLSVDLDAAAATYAELLSNMENTPRLTKEEQAGDLGMELGKLSIRAIVGLQSIDRSKDGEPVVEPDMLEKRKRGQILYLRPLLSSGHLLLPNQCVPGVFKVGYRTEPEHITLEALLYRVMGADLNFFSLGGRPDGYGATRMVLASGGTEWQSSLKMLEESAHLILMTPHLSEGVRWEIKLLSERQSLGKALFIMPPLATDIDVAKVWAEATPMMAEHGLEVPPYHPDGSIFRFGQDGRVAERWEFGLLWQNRLLAAIEHLLPPS